MPPYVGQSAPVSRPAYLLCDGPGASADVGSSSLPSASRSGTGASAGPALPVGPTASPTFSGSFPGAAKSPSELPTDGDSDDSACGTCASSVCAKPGCKPEFPTPIELVMPTGIPMAVFVCLLLRWADPRSTGSVVNIRTSTTVGATNLGTCAPRIQSSLPQRPDDRGKIGEKMNPDFHQVSSKQMPRRRHQIHFGKEIIPRSSECNQPEPPNHNRQAKDDQHNSEEHCPPCPKAWIAAVSTGIVLS